MNPDTLSEGRIVENSDYAKFVGRTIRAYARMVGGEGDIDALPDMIAQLAEMRAAVVSAIEQLRSVHGYSWEDVGIRIGVDRNSARERWNPTPVRRKGERNAP
jgi:hypothetical protein